MVGTNTWINPDGLLVKFGTTESQTDLGGEYASEEGPFIVQEIKLRLPADITGTSAIPGSGTGLSIPKGAVIAKVEVFVEAAVTGAAGAVLNVGLVGTDMVTSISATGILNGQTLTSLQAVGFATAATGSLIGTPLTAAGLIVANSATAAFSNGKVAIRVFYFTPQTVG